jgi:hypothetical protein
MAEFGEVVIFNTIQNVPTGNQAKVSRMYLATQYPNEICMLNDVDMLILNSSFLIRSLVPIENDKIVAIGANAYFGTESEGKFPMYYTTAMGKTFQYIVNPLNLKYEDLLGTWKYVYQFDNKESLTNPPENFSDESLLRVLLHRWKDKNRLLVHIHRNFNGMRAVERIDRANWSLDVEKLKSGWYIDSHLPRPMNTNYNKIKCLLDFFNIKDYKLDNWI